MPCAILSVTTPSVSLMFHQFWDEFSVSYIVAAQTPGAHTYFLGGPRTNSFVLRTIHVVNKEKIASGDKLNTLPLRPPTPRGFTTQILFFVLQRNALARSTANDNYTLPPRSSHRADDLNQVVNVEAWALEGVPQHGELVEDAA